MNIIKTYPLNAGQMGIYPECIEDEDLLKYNIVTEYCFGRKTKAGTNGSKADRHDAGTNDEGSKTDRHDAGRDDEAGGSIDAERLKKACDAVFTQYDIFSCGVEVCGGQPMLVQYGDVRPVTALHRVSEQEYAAIRESSAHRFSMNGGLMATADVYETEDGIYLITDIHHMIYDGMSEGVFERALYRAYEAQGEPVADTAPEPAADAAVQSHIPVRYPAAPSEDKLAAGYAYFDRLLGGTDVDSNLIPDVDTPDKGTCKALYCTSGVGTAAVRKLAHDNGVSCNVVMLAAFAYALALYTGQEEVLFTSVNSGRRGKDLDDEIGFYVNTFPLYFNIDSESGIADYLTIVRQNYIETMKHDAVPFISLAERYGTRSDIMYVYQGGIFDSFEFAGGRVDKMLLANRYAVSNLDVMITEAEEDFNLRFMYRDNLYTEANIRGLAGLMSCVLAGLTREQYLKDIRLVSDIDAAFIAEFNNTSFKYDDTLTVCDMFAENAAAMPNQPAVCYGDRVLTYADFDRLTAGLAEYIRAQGIGHDDFVSVIVTRSEYMPVTAWGVVRAGAAYQPLDPSYPAERLSFMVSDCGAKLLIADRELRDLINGYTGAVLYTDEIPELAGSLQPVTAQASAVPQPVTTQTSTAPQPADTESSCGLQPVASSTEETYLPYAHYDTPRGALTIVYTSGSTGTPKGCVLENRNIACFYHSYVRDTGLGQGSRLANYASFGFDAGVSDMFMTLMAGATLYIIPEELRLDLKGIDDFFIANQITNCMMTTQVGVTFAQMTKCETLKALIVGGEKLTPFTHTKNFKILNGYGPSETFAHVCCHEICDDSKIQPVGRPNRNTRLYIADRYLRMLPAGACGELCIAGGSVGRGYLGRPEKTAEVFVSNPFETDPYYSRMYRTGDIARILPLHKTAAGMPGQNENAAFLPLHGTAAGMPAPDDETGFITARGNGFYAETDIVGRRDGQVKVRGYRVELKEIEQVLRGADSIRDVSVQAYDSPAGGKFIAAYVTADGQADLGGLKRYIADRKPGYMVPEVIMQLDEIPLNVNGKVDRRRLPAPKRHVSGDLSLNPAYTCTAAADNGDSKRYAASTTVAAAMGTASSATTAAIGAASMATTAATGTAPTTAAGTLCLPRNDIQRRIYDCAAEVLGSRDFGIDTDLFAAGLSSLGIIRLNVALADEFGVSLTIRDIRKHDTVEKLEKHITGLQDLASENEETDYPLTKMQEGIYVECIAAPDATMYNVPTLLKIDGGLDLQRLKNAIASAVNAHPYIMTTLCNGTDGTVRQRNVNGAVFSANEIEDISCDSIDNIRDTLIKPFKLLGTRLFRIALIHAESLYFFMDIHHIIADGTAVNIFLGDVAEAYRGRTLEKESFSGFDVAQAETTARTGEELAASREHFAGMLADADTDFLPAGDLYPDSSVDSGIHESYSTPECAAEVQRFCHEKGVSVNGLMLTAFGLTLARYNGGDYSVFTTVYNGRNDSRTAGTVAMLAKTLPVRVDLTAAATTADASTAAAALTAAASTVGLPAADIVPAGAPITCVSPCGLATEVAGQLLESMLHDTYSFAEINHEFGVTSDVMFIYQGESFTFDTFCNVPAQLCELETADRKAPLSLQVFYEDGRFRYRADYDNHKYSAALVGAVVSAFNSALNGLCTCRDINDISLADEQMLEALDEYNRTEHPFDETRTMAGWFEETAGRYPGNTAVVCEGRSYTYAQLMDISSALAAYINSLGIGRNDFVPILVDRNEYMAIATLGVIRAGAAYEPLDPAYPADRLRYMVEDAGAGFMIADRQYAELVGEMGIRVLYTDEIEKLEPAEGYKTSALPDDRFVIIYTSGTTGTPKGNVLAHRNPVSLFDFHIRDAGLGPDAHTAYYTGFSFDAGMLDLHASLLSGGTLYIIPEDMRLELDEIDRFFIDHEITHSSMTMQMGGLFLQMTGCRTLRYFQVGGEKLVPVAAPAGCRFVNGYGPSECTIYSSGFNVRDEGALQPIGRAHDNLRYYVVDRHGHRQPFGAAGELMIAGLQVGCGYLHQPEKTAKVFTANPYTQDKGYTRLYHTGDVVRMLTDGNIDFIGRRDGQVKIRGFRVELTEIEQEVRRFTGITNATVQAFDDPAGGKFIAAYVVSDNEVDAAELKKFIGSTKPSYMIPAAVVQLETIPLTANGKIDKRALPTPAKQAADSTQTGAAPANSLEETFCRIFKETLGLGDVYADDDFFTIGGSSITAAQVIVKCNTAGYDVAFKHLFENPTPQKLAAFVMGKVSSDTVAPTGAEKAKYDYSCLDYNVKDNLPAIRNNGVGDVLITGVTGFLGAHVYRALIEMTKGRVICLIRSKSGMSSRERFMMTMTYYFEDWYDEKYDARTVIVDADLNDEDIDGKLDGLSFDTIINNAANVKHFDSGDKLLTANFKTVENLIELAHRRGVRLVQASSLSVCGESVNGSIPQDFRFREFNLNIGQSLENKYVYSKYLAEQAIIDATSRGYIRGRIIRLGNLAARESDGEFQINPSNSGLFKIIRGYIRLGCYPVDMMDATIEFSPIDKVAEAMVLLAGTPDEFTVFHAKNCHEIHYGYLIHALKTHGHRIDIVEHDEFEERYKAAIEHEKDLSEYTGFIAYLNRKDESVTAVMVYNDDDSNSQAAAGKQQYETRLRISSDTEFTTKALYRLGFAWPLTSREYLDSMIQMLDEKAFF